MPHDAHTRRGKAQQRDTQERQPWTPAEVRCESILQTLGKSSTICLKGLSGAGFGRMIRESIYKNSAAHYDRRRCAAL